MTATLSPSLSCSFVTSMLSSPQKPPWMVCCLQELSHCLVWFDCFFLLQFFVTMPWFVFCWGESFRQCSRAYHCFHTSLALSPTLTCIPLPLRSVNCVCCVNSLGCAAHSVHAPHPLVGTQRPDEPLGVCTHVSHQPARGTARLCVDAAGEGPHK